MNQNIKNAFIRAIDVTKEYKNIILFLLLVNIVFFFFGQWMVARGLPGVMEFRKEVIKQLPDLIYLQPLTGSLTGYLTLQILYTFAFNLIIGALITTTLPGIIFFMPYLITVLRAWSIGVIFYGIFSNTLIAIVFYGTFALEFGAYILAAAAGIDIGLSILMPSRKNRTGRLDAFKASLRDTLSIYLIIALLLLIGAIWEIGWLNYIGFDTSKDLTLTHNIDML